MHLLVLLVGCMPILFMQTLCKAGGCKSRDVWDICRASWIALLAEQGFAPVVAAGQATAPPRLLGRQVVVVGVSDGAIRGPAPTHLARRLQALRPPPAAGLVSGFRALALRDSLPAGAWGTKHRSCFLGKGAQQWGV